MNHQDESEYVTGEQSFSYRKRRGRFRYPRWNIVQEWRNRWTKETVEKVLVLLGHENSVEKVKELTGFAPIEITDVHGNKKIVPDLRGLDVVLVPETLLSDIVILYFGAISLSSISKFLG